MAVAETRKAAWTPSWAVHPGEVLEEHLEARGLTQADFARRADMTAKHVSTILSGKAPVTIETARAFERVLGLKATVWARLQDAWDLHLSEQSEQAVASTDAVKEWVAQFPVTELRKRGHLPATAKTAEELYGALLTFFGVASKAAFSKRFDRLAVQYRHSIAHRSDDACLRSWLQLGEIQARNRKVAPYDADTFQVLLSDVKALTLESVESFFPILKNRCAQAGVQLVAVKPLPKTRLSGAAWWISSDQAIIQLSLRHKTNDHFWFSFCHEAGHILLHKRDVIFADDETNGCENTLEKEADLFAEETLVGRDAINALISRPGPLSKNTVCAFSKSIGVHAGIVVGMLQHKKKLPWTHMNDLKERYDWSD
ncbi:MAG: HigA family addiction module antitoxin [Brevundimonas sp.]